MSRERPRGPGLTYGIISILLVVLVAALALTARQPPPPSIAEFAPQAVEQITQTTDDLTYGRGAGAAPTPTPEGDAGIVAGSAIQVPRVRKCVGDPPRQTEDPQSPPCVPYWEGDNGGSTARGVTRDSIRIFAPTADNGSGPQVRLDVWKAWQAFFNKRFEFYGRKLDIVFSRHGTQVDAATQRAIATEADEQHGAFASSEWNSGSGYHYHQELARRGVVSSTGAASPVYREADLAKLAPYLWQYHMEIDRMFLNVGQWLCARVFGGKAIHGGADVSSDDRQLGVILRPWYDDQTVGLAPLKTGIAECGGTFKVEMPKPGPALDGNAATNAMLQMKTQGVTTIVCLCGFQAQQLYDYAATSQGYFPEWITSSFGATTSNFIQKNVVFTFNQPEQKAHMFGLTFYPRQLRLDDEPYWWAVSEMAPGLSRGSKGNPSDDFLETLLATCYYHSLLILASGIQLAGPNLTPAAFERGLQRARFPNPPHRINAGKVGFGSSGTPVERLGPSHSMTTDAAELWWSNTEKGPYNGDTPGTWCYTDDGQRREYGAWPKGDVAFQGPCNSGFRE